MIDQNNCRITYLNEDTQKLYEEVIKSSNKNTKNTKRVISSQ